MDEWRMNEEWWRLKDEGDDFKLLRGLRTDICECRVAFEAENWLEPTIINSQLASTITMDWQLTWIMNRLGLAINLMHQPCWAQFLATCKPFRLVTLYTLFYLNGNTSLFLRTSKGFKWRTTGGSSWCYPAWHWYIGHWWGQDQFPEMVDHLDDRIFSTEFNERVSMMLLCRV